MSPLMRIVATIVWEYFLFPYVPLCGTMTSVISIIMNYGGIQYLSTHNQVVALREVLHNICLG